MQQVTTTFNTNSLASRRNLSYYARVAWDRSYDPDVVFAVVGQAVVGGTAIIKGDSDLYVTESDKFYFYDETEYVIQIEYERAMEEPTGGILTAMADVVLTNTSKRFTYGYDETIGNYILPQRVVKLGIGFQNTSLPVFKGVTKEMKENRARRELYMHCLDYLDTFAGYTMNSTMFENMRSDEIIEQILIEVGFNPNQYQLDEGLNPIEFAWFDAGTKASEAIKEICEAEEAVFYQDEGGILRFENRERSSWDPYLGVQVSLTMDDIIEMEYDYGKIVNKCSVYAKPRVVQAEQIVWTSDSVVEIPANSEVTVWAEYKYVPTDELVPCYSIVTPVEGTDFISNTLSSGLGDDMADDVSMIEFEGFAQSAKMVLRNTNASWSAYLTTFQLRGTPAIIVNTIQEIFEDAKSIELYGEQSVEIDNDYIDDPDYAHQMARRIVDKYSNPLKRLIIKIKGLPQLQLRDTVAITDSDTGETKSYRLMGIKGVLNANEGFTQELTLREITATETVQSPHRVISAKARIA